MNIVSGIAQIHASCERGIRYHGSRELAADVVTVSATGLVDPDRSGPIYTRFVEPRATDCFEVAAYLTRADETLRVIDTYETSNPLGMPQIKIIYRASTDHNTKAGRT